MDALRSFGERLRILREEKPLASETDLREAVESAVRVIVTRAGMTENNSRELEPNKWQLRLRCREKRCTFRGRAGRPARTFLDPSLAECCGGWVVESEVEQMHNYISRIGFNLHEAIGNRDADLIRSYHRALHSGIARAHEAANREADARGWDPVAVDGMLQEVEESTATLLLAAEQVLQDAGAGGRGQS
jgi:hypothetical protein